MELYKKYCSDDEVRKHNLKEWRSLLDSLRKGMPFTSEQEFEL
jgi:hypothetical protein